MLSLGAGGTLWVTETDAERLSAPAVPVLSGVGAGDSLVAGIVLGLARGLRISEAMRYGLAAATASVMNAGTRLCRAEDVERLLPSVCGAAIPGLDERTACSPAAAVV